jgi:hypothetical protein
VEKLQAFNLLFFTDIPAQERVLKPPAVFL